jgi:hypothetical protein
MPRNIHDILKRSARNAWLPAHEARQQRIAEAVINAARKLQAGRIGAFGTLKAIHSLLPEPATIGELHDAVRALVDAKRVRLHPFTQAMYLLPDAGGSYCLIHGNEIMAYCEALPEPARPAA